MRRVVGFGEILNRRHYTVISVKRERRFDPCQKTMDDELLELQRQFEFAQQAKSLVRLFERNIVELVQKLQELHIIDFDLLHTVSGKEYIIPERLRHEMLSEGKKKSKKRWALEKHF